MEYNLYKLELDNKPILTKIDYKLCPESIRKGLLKFETKLIEAALKEQQNKIGYHKLGNEIRYRLSEIFSSYETKNVLIKATENRRSVHKLILEWLSQAYSSDIYLFVYSTEIGKKIVDSSAINLESIVQTFEEVLTYFNLKYKVVLYIIEMLEITGYRIERVESSNTTKIYYKLIKNA